MEPMALSKHYQAPKEKEETMMKKRKRNPLRLGSLFGTDSNDPYKEGRQPWNPKKRKGKTVWGKGTLRGREKGLAKSKPLMGPLTKRKEDLWGKNE